jgi:hypothetical protein
MTSGEHPIMSDGVCSRPIGSDMSKRFRRIVDVSASTNTPRMYHVTIMLWQVMAYGDRKRATSPASAMELYILDGCTAGHGTGAAWRSTTLCGFLLGLFLHPSFSAGAHGADYDRKIEPFQDPVSGNSSRAKR